MSLGEFRYNVTMSYYPRDMCYYKNTMASSIILVLMEISQRYVHGINTNVIDMNIFKKSSC